MENKTVDKVTDINQVISVYKSLLEGATKAGLLSVDDVCLGKSALDYLKGLNFNTEATIQQINS